MPIWTPDEIEILKRRGHVPTVRWLALRGKTALLRHKTDYADALGITVPDLLEQAKQVKGPECLAYQAHIRHIIKRGVDG